MVLGATFEIKAQLKALNIQPRYVENAVDAMDAVLSLKVSASTVGAQELADVAARLERLLRRGDVVQAVLVETSLAGAVERADHALGVFLGA